MLLAASLASLQLVLDRGQRLDWLDLTDHYRDRDRLLCVLCLPDPQFHGRQTFLDLRLLVDRNYSLGLLIVLIYGMLNFTPMVVMPPMLTTSAAIRKLS